MTILIMAAAGLISVSVTAAVTLAAVFHRRRDNRQAAYKVLSLLLRHRSAIKTARYDALATVGRPTRKDTDPQDAAPSRLSTSSATTPLAAAADQEPVTTPQGTGTAALLGGATVAGALDVVAVAVWTAESHSPPAHRGWPAAGR